MSKGRRVRNRKDNKRKHDIEKNEKEKCDENNEIKIITITPSVVEENYNNLFRTDEQNELKKILNTQDLVLSLLFPFKKN